MKALDAQIEVALRPFAHRRAADPKLLDAAVIVSPAAQASTICARSTIESGKVLDPARLWSLMDLLVDNSRGAMGRPVGIKQPHEEPLHILPAIYRKARYPCMNKATYHSKVTPMPLYQYRKK